VTGFQQILDLVKTSGVDCMLENGPPHVVYAEDREKAGEVEKEAEVARRIGIPVTLSDQAPLPFGITAALHFENQAHFHPGRYLAGLAEVFVREGGIVVEGVRARDVDEDGDVCHVETTAGTVSTPHVVVATQYPFLDRGGQFARMKASRSYGVAGVLPDGMSAGMTINVGSATHSTRTAHLDDERLLIVVGEGHEVGHVSDTGERWLRLQDCARDRFGVTDFRYHWSAEETSTTDHLPFAGLIAPGSERIFTACGFAGWGMTNGTASAILIRDLILGHNNPWAATFDPRRAMTGGFRKQDVKHNMHVAKTWAKGRLAGAPKGSLVDLQPGEAAVLEVDGEQTAAYRDEQGDLHAVSSVCTHMKCTVAWNDGEKSWDCPCHGSRFDPEGHVLHGPASSPLPPRNLG
jgi:glycine/D-amino acid oxidase-like deaminating enzyme/nitrite reductase/ring-hydroxylating ferredoxin subunit